MTTTEFSTNEIERPAEPGSIGAGAEIYRRMERRSRGRPLWMTVAPIAVLAVATVGGVIAYQAAQTHKGPAPVQAQAAPPTAAPQVASVTQPKVAMATTPTAPAPVVRVTRPDHARPALAAVAHRRAARDANTAGSAGQDTSAVTPPVAMTPPPASPKPNYAPPSVTSAPAQVTVSPPPPAITAAPAPSSPAAPAPQ